MQSRPRHDVLSLQHSPASCSQIQPPPDCIGAEISNRGIFVSAPLKVECVEVGGIPIALSTSDDNFLNLLRQRYSGFLSSSRPEFELEFDLTSSGPVSDEDVQVRRNRG